MGVSGTMGQGRGGDENPRDIHLTFLRPELMTLWHRHAFISFSIVWDNVCGQ